MTMLLLIPLSAAQTVLSLRLGDGQEIISAAKRSGVAAKRTDERSVKPANCYDIIGGFHPPYK
jgi:hypothetical protein